MNLTEQSPSLKALFPFLVFIFLFLGIGIFLDDFYAFPSPLAVIVGIATAILMFKGSTTSKINTLLEGCGDPKILTMCLIYLLAGAFASVAAAMGAVESVVNLGLTFISPEMLPVGIFLLAAFLSTATGTSVGSIVALGPIVIGLADQSGVSLVLLSATLLGGSMFGDNLSFISDTTIAATQSLGVKMKDKFKMNFFIALPTALITIIILFFLGQNSEGTGILITGGDYSFFKIIPYLLVIVLSIIGVNVFVVLFFGTIVAGAMGIINQDFELLFFSKKVYEGFLGMSDIFLLSLLTGGLAALVAKAGGIAFLLKVINRRIKSKRSAQLGIASLVSFTNMAIANNTVSIIITGPLAREISEDYDLDKRNSAALLDIFSCVFQGLLPYGAQVLLLLSFAEGRFNFLELIANAWYLLILPIVAVVAVLFSSWGKHASVEEPSF